MAERQRTLRQLTHDAGVLGGSFTAVAAAALLTAYAFSGGATNRGVPQAAPTQTTRPITAPAISSSPVTSPRQTPGATPEQPGTVLIDTVGRTSSLPSTPRSTAPPTTPGRPPPVTPPTSPPPVAPPPRTAAAVSIKVPLGVLPADTVRVGDLLQIGGTGK